MPFKAVTFDAYGTLLRNEDLMLIPRRMVADHGLSVPVDDVWRAWIDLYFEATQQPPFRTLREIQGQILSRVLRQLDVAADPTAYVDLFFQVTTTVVLYPEALEVLNALGPVRSAIVSNADHEHVAAWNFKLPVHFILVSEAVRAYKPHPLVFSEPWTSWGFNRMRCCTSVTATWTTSRARRRQGCTSRGSTARVARAAPTYRSLISSFVI